MMQPRTIDFTLIRILLGIALCMTALASALAQQETVLHTFALTVTDGNGPLDGLVSDAAGNLYGTTYDGGAPDLGTVFEFVRGSGGTWTEKLIHIFTLNGRDGYEPRAALIFDKAGNLYGTTSFGGHYGDGTVFELSPNANGTWTETILHHFSGKDGLLPEARLVFDKAGNLYGTTSEGGSSISSAPCSPQGCGTVFELKHRPDGSWAEKVLHNFDDNGVDGFTPVASIAFDSAGNLYATAEEGGAYNFGILFELTPKPHGEWTETILHNFNQDGTDGIHPGSGLLFDASGNLYGTTSGGGPGRGTAFEFSPGSNGTWTETILHDFGIGTDGSIPWGNLTFDTAGNIYGATPNGGTWDSGTVFQLSPSTSGWTETILHMFGNYPDGVGPNGSMVRDSAGNLYGTTQSGGNGQTCIDPNSCGTVFEITP